jgi:hypothetical protein
MLGLTRDGERVALPDRERRLDDRVGVAGELGGREEALGRNL